MPLNILCVVAILTHVHGQFLSRPWLEQEQFLKLRQQLKKEQLTRKTEDANVSSLIVHGAHLPSYLPQISARKKKLTQELLSVSKLRDYPPVTPPSKSRESKNKDDLLSMALSKDDFSILTPTSPPEEIVEEDDNDFNEDEDNNIKLAVLPSGKHHMRFEDFSTCGKKHYDPIREVCFEGRPYNNAYFGVCGSKLYRIQISFCYESKIHSRLRKGVCGGQLFDRLKQACLLGKIHHVCGGEIYEPLTHFCIQRVYNKYMYELCGKKVIRKKTHFCFHSMPFRKNNVKLPKDIALWGRSMSAPKVLEVKSQLASIARTTPKVDNVDIRELVRKLEYEHKLDPLNVPLSRFMEKNKQEKYMQVASMVEEVQGEKKDVLPSYKCGAFQYNTKTHFCFKNKVSQRCKTLAFNPQIFLCFRNSLYTRKIYDTCANNMFNKFTHMCLSNHIIPLNKRVIVENWRKLVETRNKVETMKKQYALLKEQCSSRYNLRRSTICSNGVLFNRQLHVTCGDNQVYSPLTHYCTNGKLSVNGFKKLFK